MFPVIYRLREDYINLGIKQSIYQIEERSQAYDLFEKYCEFLSKESLYDSNIVSYEYLPLCEPRYHLIVVDEIQDFTNIQLTLMLKALHDPEKFLLCGDSNQIVHPNFFSWSKIKTMFYQQKSEKTTEITRILRSNYRNTPEVVEVANKILKIKNKRFGSIDKESNYLVTSQSNSNGNVYCLKNTEKLKAELNEKTKKSTQFAIVVLHEDQKQLVKKYFQTPLVFSIQEAKGLEYENVILYDFISSEDKKFYEITKDVSAEDLKRDLVYSRVKDKTDRSMEIYKFYINSLYVAITRAVKNIYIVETATKHALFKLLSIEEAAEGFSLDVKESTLEDWQREARKLELQGKQEQADEIKKTILQTKKANWTIIDKTVIEAIKRKALDPTSNEKKFKLALLEYAVMYDNKVLLQSLISLDFKPAQNTKKTWDMIEKKYFMFYRSNNTTSVMRKVDEYGVDFRNIFNQTPLMIAAKLGNDMLIKQLIDKGAKRSLTGNMGKTAFQIALHAAYFNKKYAASKLAKIYHHLEPASISIKVDNKLIKIDSHLMEYFLFNLITAILHQLFHKLFWPNMKHFFFRGFSTQSFIDNVKHFPNKVLLDRRKKREYISSILSKNEMNRVGPYNRKLFLRVERGYYLLNPKLEVKTKDQWINIYELLGLKDVVENLGEHNSWPLEQIQPASTSNT